MNKIEFIAKMAKIAEEMASIFVEYTSGDDGWSGNITSGDGKISLCNITASIQNGNLATLHFDVGTVDSEKHLVATKYSDWSIEDK